MGVRHFYHINLYFRLEMAGPDPKNPPEKKLIQFAIQKKYRKAPDPGRAGNNTRSAPEKKIRFPKSKKITDTLFGNGAVPGRE